MAKPIRATPTLKGNDAKEFIRKILREEKNPSQARKKLIKESFSVNFNY